MVISGWLSIRADNARKCTVVPPLACVLLGLCITGIVNSASSHNIIKLKMFKKNSNKVETAKLSHFLAILYGKK